MAKQFLDELGDGDRVDSKFAVHDTKDVKPTKNGNYFFTLTIADRTGSMDLKYWGDADEGKVRSVHEKFQAGDVVRVVGRCSTYNGSRQISVNTQDDISKCADYDPKDLLRASKRDIGEMKEEFLSVIDGIGDADIRRLLKSMFDDTQLLDKYAHTPAAMTVHHNYLGGLLEHVLSMVSLARRLAKTYAHLNEDLLVAGCILHDIGKVVEYETTTTITITDKGRMLGHINIGHDMVSGRIKTLEEFPDMLAQKILHMILSHHGKKEWGSPLEPAFPEAIALHHIDNLDAQTKKNLQLVEGASEGSDWIYMNSRYLFVK